MILQKSQTSSPEPYNHIIAQYLANNKGLSYNQLQFPFMEQMSFCYKNNSDKAQKITYKKRLTNYEKPKQLEFGFLENIQ